MADQVSSPEPVRIPDHLQTTPVTARGLRSNRFVRVTPIEDRDRSPYDPNVRQPSVGLRSGSSPSHGNFVRSPSSVLDSGRLRVVPSQPSFIEIEGVRARLGPGFEVFVEDGVAYISRLHYVSCVENGMLPVSNLFDAVQVLRAAECELTHLTEIFERIPFASAPENVSTDNPVRNSNERATFDMIRREVRACEHVFRRCVERMSTVKSLASALGYDVSID